MAEQYENFKQKAFSALRGLARECPTFEDAEMLVGGAEAKASLFQQDSYKSIDTEWIDAIEKALPALDIIIRNPTVAIENVDEILPVELSRHITDESIKHLSQHTNLILDVKKNGEVVPQKILNVYHDETLLTYENKFVNTLLARLFGFVDKRYRVLQNSCGIERTYKFDYQTEFEHLLEDEEGKNSAKIHLNIELTSPLNDQAERSLDIKDKYLQAVERIKRINMALISYRSSAFSRALGRNYVRPPVVRTNAILKNKNFKECLTLWEYIESFDKVGYTVRVDAVAEKPSSQYIGDLYSSVALQYVDFYYGVAEREDKRFLSKKHLFELEPDFDTEFMEEELEDYQVFDAEYKKTVPVSRLMNNRKKLSADEKRIHRALVVALKADEILNAEMKAAEAEMRRLERQRRLEEEERRRAEEAERARLAALLTQIPIAVRYRRSFLSRYIQSGENLQEYYGRLKNKLLSYEGVKSTISWKADRFSKGRTTLARIDVRGKRVYLYLALDPAAYEGSKYRFIDVSDKKADTPMLVRIKGKLGILHGLQLIEQLAEKYALTAVEREDISYAAPYEDDQTLIGKGLIKIVFPKGAQMEDGQVLTKENLRDLFEGRVKDTDILPPIEEEPPAPVAVRYRRSFLSRYIQSSEELQDYYGRLKNKLLGYKKVKSKISWKADRFSKGRTTLARIDVRGKRVYLYLALDPAAYEGSKYRFVDVSDKKADTPMLVKIKGRLGILHALQLIEQLAEKYDLTAIEREDISYAAPYEDDQTLIDKGLIKIVLSKGVKMEGGQVLTKENLRDLFEIKAKDTDILPPVEEELPAPITVRYRRSFLSRYIQSSEELQDYYGRLKNKLLGYKKVKSKISWKADRFSKGRTTLARIDVRGKRVYLYLALDPAAYEGSKYRFVDVSDKKADTPMLVKIKGRLGISHALQLVERLAAEYGLVETEREDIAYGAPYETDDALVEKGLIKVVYPKGARKEEGQVLTREDLRPLFATLQKTSEESVEPLPALQAEPQGEEVALTVVEETEPVNLVEETEQGEERTEPLPVTEELETPLAEEAIEAEELPVAEVEERIEEEPFEEDVLPTEEGAEPVVYEENVGGRYAFIRDTLLSNGASLTQTAEGESYFLNGKPLAILRRKGSKIYLYLAVSPSVAAEEKCSFTNVAKKRPDTPILIKIKREKEMKEALTLLGVATSK